jgi:hypothetical protein
VEKRASCGSGWRTLLRNDGRTVYLRNERPFRRPRSNALLYFLISAQESLKLACPRYFTVFGSPRTRSNYAFGIVYCGYEQRTASKFGLYSPISGEILPDRLNRSRLTRENVLDRRGSGEFDVFSSENVRFCSFYCSCSCNRRRTLTATGVWARFASISRQLASGGSL